MYCKQCGREIADDSMFCSHCGASQSSQPQPADTQPRPQVNATENDAPSFGFAALCFFFPIVGLILYLVWKDTLPMRARSCGKGAIIGVIVQIIWGILWGIIGALVGAGM